MKRSFTYHLLAGCFIGTLICIPMASAQSDWLNQKDRQFEEVFQKTDAAFDKAMQDGVKELDAELAQIWGNARQLPEPKVWVGYSQNKRTRIIVDYEHGEMTIEGFDTTEQDLFSDFQDTLMENSIELDERAILRKKLIEKTNELWGNEPSDSFPMEKRVKRPRNTWKPTYDPTEERDKTYRPTQKQQSTKDGPAPRQKLIFVKRQHELSALIEPRVKPRFVKRDIIFSNGKKAKLARLSVPLRKDRDQLSAQSLRDPIDEAARKYKLPRSLFLSVIKNESAFNPRARSHANAIGLMQLVPTSGGKEAYTYLQGREATPNLGVLYDPYENIRLGTAYLHLLNTRYFGKIKDATTRQYLIIAAYNTGAGNVAKAFTGKMKLGPAIRKINTMNADEVYRHLQTNLPYAETKTYLARVSRDIQIFTDWDDRA